MRHFKNRRRRLRTWFRIGGRDYSVHNPRRVRQGMRLWIKALRKALPRHQADDRTDGGPGS